jgi:hypothetical protein
MTAAGPTAVPATPSGTVGRPTRAEAVALAGVFALAAVLRYAWLPTRGQFDADQAHDMLVLRDLVANGVLPLVGPPTSVGAGHHGALYYYLLAPAAAVSGGADPVPVVALVAALGIAAVGLTWWLARSIGGPVAGLAAALVLATSATAVESSTFLWNPNVVAAASALALVGAREAWIRRSARWWLLAALGAMVAMQSHWLAALLAPPLAALWIADLVRAGPGARRRSLLGIGVGAAAILAAGFVPLAVHEAVTGGADIRAIVAWATGGGESAALSAPVRVLVAFLRTIGWPLAGLVTDAPVANGLALLLVTAIVAWRLVLGRGDERTMVGWLGGTIAFAAVVLGLFFPSSTVVTPLPVDHYHAFLDPVVAAIVGIGVAALMRAGARSEAARLAGVATGAGILAAIVGWNLVAQPPATSPLGTWPDAREDAARIARDAGPDAPIGVMWVPDFKSADLYRYPLMVARRAPVDPAGAAVVVIGCDGLFVDDCGGPAERRALTGLGNGARYEEIDRFVPIDGRTVTVWERR